MNVVVQNDVVPSTFSMGHLFAVFLLIHHMIRYRFPIRGTSDPKPRLRAYCIVSTTEADIETELRGRWGRMKFPERARQTPIGSELGINLHLSSRSGRPSPFNLRLLRLPLKHNGTDDTHWARGKEDGHLRAG